jgi:hypothetical protein
MSSAFTPLVEKVRSIFSGKRSTGERDLSRVRFVMLEQVLDCDRKTVRRVRRATESARTMVQLWLVRSEIFQAVSERFGQSEATRRVALIAPYFDTFPQSKRMQLAA